MITMTFLACLLASPTDCQERRLQFHEPGLSVFACSAKAQKILADPQKGNVREGEFIARYKCQRSDALHARI